MKNYMAILPWISSVCHRRWNRIQWRRWEWRLRGWRGRCLRTICMFAGWQACWRKQEKGTNIFHIQMNSGTHSLHSRLPTPRLQQMYRRHPSYTKETWKVNNTTELKCHLCDVCKWVFIMKVCNCFLHNNIVSRTLSKRNADCFFTGENSSLHKHISRWGTII